MRLGQTCSGVVDNSDNDDDGPGGVRCDHRRAACAAAAARRDGIAVAIGTTVVVKAHRVSCPPYTSVSCLFTTGCYYYSILLPSYPNRRCPSPLLSRYYTYASTCLYNTI